MEIDFKKLEYWSKLDKEFLIRYDLEIYLHRNKGGLFPLSFTYLVGYYEGQVLIVCHGETIITEVVDLSHSPHPEYLETLEGYFKTRPVNINTAENQGLRIKDKSKVFLDNHDFIRFH